MADDGDPLLGTLFDGRYRIEARLGQGGMGAVYRAEQTAMQRRVAIKLVQPELTRDPVVARRLLREAKGTFSVDSDHAVRVLDCAITADGLPYVVLEYLDGRTVARELDVDGPMAPARALAVARQIALALDAAHRVGLVHRDLKPDNVMLVTRGTDPDWVKVLDFGLAKLVSDAPGAALSQAALTQAGMVFGTPEYMAPEQAMDQPLDGRCDLYALGACLFEMLTGRPPFVASSAMRLLADHVQKAPPRLVDVAPDLAAWPGRAGLELVVARLLAKAPADRYADARSTIAALDEVAGAMRTAPAAARALGRTRPPGASSMLIPALSSATPAADTDEPPPRRGSRWWLAAPVIAAGGVAVLLWLDRGTSEPTPVAPTPATTAPSPPSSPTPPPATDAGSATVTGSATAATTADAATATATGSASASDTAPKPEPPPAPRPPTVPPSRNTLATVLREAEDARTARQPMRQLALARRVLELSPGHSRALFLAGEVLVNSDDLAAGCPLLARARGSTAAQRAAATAGCPVD